jgi:hypothetical protein
LGLAGTPLGRRPFRGLTIAKGHLKPISNRGLVNLPDRLVTASLMAPTGALATAVYLCTFMMTIGIGVPRSRALTNDRHQATACRLQNRRTGRENSTHPIKEVRLPWLVAVLSIFTSALLFCVVGAPFGGFLFLTGLAIAWGRPLMVFGSAELASLAATFGAVPAFITGILAGLLRIYVRPILLLAVIMAPLGALITAIYLVAFMMTLGIGVPWINKVILIGGVSAFCCTFLLRRKRPSSIFDRPAPSAASRISLPLRYRRMSSLWAGWEP